MKKIVLSVVIACLSFGVNAQTGQLDEIKNLGEGTVFKEYWGISKEGDKYSGNAYDAKKVLKFTHNAFDKLMAFEMKDEAGKTSTNHGFGHLEPNHYTQPSVFHKEGHNFAYLYVDGLLYWLKRVSDPNNIGNFEINGIYVPEKKAGDTDAPKKKMSMKEKMAALKGGGVPASLTDKDHEAIIKDYLAAMKPIQEAATANLTDEEKKEIEALENADAEQLLKMQADQRERAKKFAENRAKEEGIETRYTIQNNTGGLAHFISNDGTGDGGYFFLNASGKNSVRCKDNTYYAVQDGMGTWRKGGLIVTGSSACGKTIAVE